MHQSKIIRLKGRMTMKKVLAWVLTLAMTAALAVGGTLAYLTDTDEDVNVMTLGKVKIDQLEYERMDVESSNENADVQEFHDNKPLLPAVTEKDFNYVPSDSYVDWEQIGKDGYTSPIWDPSKINNEVDKMVFVKNKGDYDAYVRTVFAFEAGNYANLTEFKSKVHLNINETDWTWKWNDAPVEIGGAKYFVATATYDAVLNPGALTEISLSQIVLDSSATNADVEAFGDTYQVLVLSQGIQADGFTDANAALNEGFGTVPTAEGDYPFADDNPIQGIDLYSALHYVDGDTATTPITASVSKVVFGLNKDHGDIVNSYTGTLVDVGQDVPVYAYYVKDGSNYQVYFLASDDIYLPANCYEFFYNTQAAIAMNALTSVDTSNANTSRVTDMTRMFRNCSGLTELNLNHWDVSNVTSLERIFYGCTGLKTLNIKQWDVSSVTNLNYAFYTCNSLTELDLSGWNTCNVTTMNQLFFKSANLKRIDVSGWNTGNATSLYATFAYLPALEYVNMTGWDVSKVENCYGLFMNDNVLKAVDGTGALAFTSATNASGMFQNCKALTYLDATSWNFGKIDSLRNMFRNCNSLETLEGSGNWSCANVTMADVVFLGCYKLKSLDVSNWDVSKVTSFDHFLASEHQNAADMALEEIIGLENWRPEKLTGTGSMFYGCGKLKTANMSGWTVPNLESMSHMFADCHSLQSVSFAGWQTPKLNNLDALFNHCLSLKTVDMSMFDTSNVTVFAQTFEICSSLEEIKGLENWNTAKGNDFSEMFSGCSSLKELNLSSFDTTSLYTTADTYPGIANWGFLRFLNNCTGLQKITFGPNFDFDGKGCPDDYKFDMSASTNVEGWDGHWYNAATGEALTPDQIPEKTAATYVAVKP